MTDPTTIQDLPRLKGRYPFRIGVTSYVFEDHLLPNVQALAPYADDVELVLFESEDVCNLPSTADIVQLRAIADANALSYTVHFPIDKPLGKSAPSEDRRALQHILRVIDLTRPLAPYAFLLHLNGIKHDAGPADVRRWQARLLPLLREIATAVVEPQRICLENLDYPFEWCDPLIEACGFSVCTDAGHLWAADYDWRAHAARYRAQTRVIHLYGTTGGQEHVSLAVMDRHLVVAFLQAMAPIQGVLTLETFGLAPSASSMEVLEACLAESQEAALC